MPRGILRPSCRSVNHLRYLVKASFDFRRKQSAVVDAEFVDLSAEVLRFAGTISADFQVEGGDRIAGTAGEDWRGLYEFKTRFGGQIVTYPQTEERQYWPMLATVARRFYSAGS